MIALNLESPLVPQTEKGWLPATPEARQARPPTYGILIVDDEPCLRGVLRITMQQQGFAVWLAANGRQALDQYQRHQDTIDVVLMDVRMPGLDGPQTLALLQELDVQVRCCFMSGGFGRYTEWQLSNLSSCVVIRKPFEPTEVGEMLWEMARKANLSRTANVGGKFLNSTGAADERDHPHLVCH